MGQLKSLRKQKGITQEKMAQMLGYKGKSGYCQLENGIVKITLEKATKIAEILGEDVNTIFFETEVHDKGTLSKKSTGTIG